MTGEYELGQEFFRWEFATAVAGSILGINPFDQPDVQAAKDKTARGARRRVRLRTSSLERSAEELFAQAAPGDYVCIQAFVNPTAATEAKVLELAAQARRPRRAASSRTASGRATCTRPGSSTRAARRRGSTCRWSTTPATSSPFPASRSGSDS